MTGASPKRSLPLLIIGLATMGPWMIAKIEWLKRNMGDDWWPYGYDANRATLDTFLRYHHEQGLSKRRLQPHELFAPGAIQTDVSKDDNASSNIRCS